jgi:hypothetical protein
MARKPKLHSLGVAAVALRVPRAWLEAEAEAGRLPALHAGNRWLFNLPVVECELARRAARPATGQEPLEHGARARP